MIRLVLVALVTSFWSCTPPMMGPKPGALRAGVATTVVQVPVGAPTGGYSRRASEDDPGSRWARNFPSTFGVHTEATARAIAFTDGITRSAMVRLDVCLATPSLRERIRQKLDAANEPAKFIVQATHTHGHVARFFEPVHIGTASGADFIAIGMDVYDAELDDRLASAAADSILAAFAQLKPVSVGAASVEAPDLSRDRRCANDPVYGRGYRDTKLSVVRFDEVDEGGLPTRPLTALMYFSVHGTVLERGNRLLTTDAPGALELGASDALGVPVYFAQGSAGDVSPNGSPMGFEGLQRLEWLGRLGGRYAKQAFDLAAPMPAPKTVPLLHVDRGVPMTREAVGYKKGEFPEHGAVNCAVGGPSGSMCGSVSTPPERAADLCAPVEPRPKQVSVMSLVRIGDVGLLTLPGEPSTAVGLKSAEALAQLGTTTNLALGYAQDHYGYLLEQDDFLRGGYEPTVSPLGWKLGAYLIDQAHKLVENRDKPQDAPTKLVPQEYTPRSVEESESMPHITTQVTDTQRTQAAVLVFSGGDPALGSPSVSLEREVNGAFVPVMASPTRPLENGPEIIRGYEATPTVSREPMATKRQHQWTATLEFTPDFPLGKYRMVAKGRAKVAGTLQTFKLEAMPFSVVAARSISLLTSRVLSDGRVVLTARYAPNQAKFEPGDNPKQYFRVWDEQSRADMGMLARKGGMQLSVKQGAGAATLVSAPWSEADQGYTFSLPTGAMGAFELSVEPGAVQDGLGNTNDRALTLSVNR